MSITNEMIDVALQKTLVMKDRVIVLTILGAMEILSVERLIATVHLIKVGFIAAEGVTEYFLT